MLYLQAPRQRAFLRHAAIPNATASPYSNTSTRTNQSTKFQVRTVLCSELGLSDCTASAMLVLREVSRTMKTVPKYEAHLKCMIMMLTMRIGVDRLTLASLVEENPAFLLSQAPFMEHNLRELRRAVAFHFDIFYKISADEFPESWRAMLRQSPDLLLLEPHKAEPVLRWLASLVNTAGLDSTTSTAFAKYLLMNTPEILNKNLKILREDANKVWQRAKILRLEGNCAIYSPAPHPRRYKKSVVGEAARARFILAYIGWCANILENEELEPLRIFQIEIIQCLGVDCQVTLMERLSAEKNLISSENNAQNNISVSTVHNSKVKSI